VAEQYAAFLVARPNASNLLIGLLGATAAATGDPAPATAARAILVGSASSASSLLSSAEESAISAFAPAEILGGIATVAAREGIVAATSGEE
jgi:threonine synthase